MHKVYLAIPHALDKVLGHVADNGKVTRRQVGFDKEIGHVNLETGDIYAERFGPDKAVGRVDLGNGKVYTTRFGPDHYEGWVSADGRMHRHRALATDAYIGQVESFVSFAHSAAAMLLLVLPALEEEADEGTATEE
ncbi:MAG: hypothetical protein R2932_06855 [Caldilineaceae bacterium]